MSAALRLTGAARHVIQTAARATPSAEICGLLIETSHGVEAQLSPNRHPKPKFGFAICDMAHARVQREARDQGNRICGCVHSHPSGDTTPSATDLLAVQDDGFIWLICAPDGRIQAWRARMQNGARWFDPMTIERSDNGRIAG